MSGSGVTRLLLTLIPTTFGAYRVVHRLVSKYSSFNRQLQSVLRDIEIAEGLFKSAIDKLLSEVIEEDRRKVMISNLESEHWQEDELRVGLQYLLGDSLFQTTMTSIQGVKETLDRIETILLKLGGLNLSDDKLTSLKHPTTTSYIAPRPSQLRLQGDNFEIRSIRKKITSIITDSQSDLKHLRDDLKSHNQSIVTTLHIRHPSSTHRPQRPTQSSKSPSNKIPRGYPNAKVKQLTSRRLYSLISKSIFCECHRLHLRLDPTSEETPIKTPKGKLKESLVASETEFSFQMTVKPHSYTEQGHARTIHSSLRFVFAARDRTAVDLHEDDNSKSNICAGLSTADEKYEKYFYDSGGSNNGFQLQVQSRSSTITATTSLDDLIVSEKLSHYDRLLIAANLAYSILPLYSSPWIRGWSLQTIQYFKAQEKPTSSPGLWTPYLSLVHDYRDQSLFGIKNREIYSLGLVLLGLGRQKRLEFSAEEEDVALARALYELCSEMGVDYQDFVQSCLYDWGNRDEDLMKEGNLDSFLNGIDVLRIRSRGFNPAASGWQKTGISSEVLDNL